jgi:hypothetical protein
MTPERNEFEAEKAEAIVAGGGLNRGSQPAKSPKEKAALSRAEPEVRIRLPPAVSRMQTVRKRGWKAAGRSAKLLWSRITNILSGARSAF